MAICTKEFSLTIASSCPDATGKKVAQDNFREIAYADHISRVLARPSNVGGHLISIVNFTTLAIERYIDYAAFYSGIHYHTNNRAYLGVNNQASPVAGCIPSILEVNLDTDAVVDVALAAANNKLMYPRFCSASDGNVALFGQINSSTGPATYAGTVFLYDPDTQSVIQTYAAGTTATSRGDIAYCPTNGRLYVAVISANAVLGLDALTLALEQTIAIAMPSSVCYDPINDQLWVLNAFGANLSIINPTTGAVVNTIVLPGSPTINNHVIYNAVKKVVAFPWENDNVVRYYDPVTFAVKCTIARADFNGPFALCYRADGKMYVQDYAGSKYCHEL